MGSYIVTLAAEAVERLGGDGWLGPSPQNTLVYCV